ncbi:MAG: hypothetical protein JWP22_427 [Ramlibacter sp.]|jgi:hypothetical protein|nr:hypothetical protein [Ramlibacter sp.]MDB5911752.1 hypothetical protein [Ramlibacter sp.]
MTLLESSRRQARLAPALLLPLLLAACAAVPPVPPGMAASPWTEQSGARHTNRQAWIHKTFPGKAPTRFTYERLDGRDVIAVQANGSLSMLRQLVHVPPQELGGLHFSWKVPALIAHADLALRDKDDSPVRIVLAFDGDRTRLSARNAALSELVRTVTGEEMPYATLMYVWCNKREAGSVIHSPRTDRIRKICLESGAARLNQWLDYQRDIAADFERAFGEAPGPLLGVGIMTDSDNTRSRTQAWYGPVRFAPGPTAR